MATLNWHELIIFLLFIKQQLLQFYEIHDNDAFKCWTCKIISDSKTSSMSGGGLAAPAKTSFQLKKALTQ